MSKSVFTFYVPATVTLDRLTLALDVINENLIADSFIGTTGSIRLEQVNHYISISMCAATVGLVGCVIAFFAFCSEKTVQKFWTMGFDFFLQKNKIPIFSLKCLKFGYEKS